MDKVSNVNYLISSAKMEQLILIKPPSSTTLRSLTIASVLSHSLNRAYLASLHSAQIAKATSYVRKTLYEIPNPAFKKERYTML